MAEISERNSPLAWAGFSVVGAVCFVLSLGCVGGSSGGGPADLGLGQRKIPEDTSDSEPDTDVEEDAAPDLPTDDVGSDVEDRADAPDVGEDKDDLAARCREGSGVSILEHGAACDGVTDDSAAIQAAIDAATENHGLVCVPETRSPCALRASLHVTDSVAIVGQGPDSGSHLVRLDTDFPNPMRETCDGPATAPSGTHDTGALFFVTGDDVTIHGLQLEGADYGDANARNTHGIWAIGTHRDPVSNLTVTDNHIWNYRGRGISLTRGEDFVFDRNTVARVGYTGIVVVAGVRGSIRDNVVDDVGAPDQCHVADQTACQYQTAYGITVTGCSATEACSSDVLILGNTVSRVPTWVGVMNHGAQRVLIADNHVTDCNFLYANTVSTAEFASHDTVFINNWGNIDTSGQSVRNGGWDVGPGGTCHISSHRTGQWLLASDTTPAEGVAAIGNTWLNSGESPGYYGDCVSLGGAVGAKVLYNVCTGDFPARTAVDLRTPHHYEDLIIAHNTFNAFDELIEGVGANATGALVAFNTLEYETLRLGFEVCGGAPCDSSWDIADQELPRGTATFDSPPSTVTVARPVPDPVPVASVEVDGDEATVTWEYSPNLAHDAFLIDARADGGPWTTLAWRAGYQDRWLFTSVNPNFVPYAPTQWRGSLPSGTTEVRVRALLGSELGEGEPAPVN